MVIIEIVNVLAATPMTTAVGLFGKIVAEEGQRQDLPFRESHVV